MKRVLLAIGIVFFSSSAFAEDGFRIDSICASVKSGESKYDLQPQGSIILFTNIQGVKAAEENPVRALQVWALASRYAEKKHCPELSEGLLYKVILNKDFSASMILIVKETADNFTKLITRMYDKVREKYTGDSNRCEKVSGFIQTPKTWILSCDKDTKHYYSSVSSRLQVIFCGNSLNDNCFR